MFRKWLKWAKIMQIFQSISVLFCASKKAQFKFKRDKQLVWLLKAILNKTMRTFQWNPFIMSKWDWAKLSTTRTKRSEKLWALSCLWSWWEGALMSGLTYSSFWLTIWNLKTFHRSTLWQTQNMIQSSKTLFSQYQ